MATFETEAELGITVPDSELRSARRRIERGIGDVEVGVSGSSGVSRAMGDGGRATSRMGGRRGRQMFRWARQRTENVATMVELLDDIKDGLGGAGGGGGGGGGLVGGILGGAGLRSMLGGGGGLAGRIGSVSLTSLVTKARLSALVKTVSSIGALITGKEIVGNLIEGELEASDVIDPLNNLGDVITGPLPLPDAVETATGIGVFLKGTSAITKFVTGTSITSLVKAGGATLGSFLGSVSITSLVTGGGATLATFLGSVAITDLFVGATSSEHDVGDVSQDFGGMGQAFWRAATGQDLQQGVSQEEARRQALQTGNTQPPGSATAAPNAPPQVQTGDTNVEVTADPNEVARQVEDEIRRDVDQKINELRREIERGSRSGGGPTP